MSLSYVSLILDYYDGEGNPVQAGSVTCTPSMTLTDTADHLLITQRPIPVSLFLNPLPSVSLVATDNEALGDAAWGWLIQPAFPGSPPGRTWLLPFAGGAVQYLSDLTALT